MESILSIPGTIVIIGRCQ